MADVRAERQKTDTNAYVMAITNVDFLIEKLDSLVLFAVVVVVAVVLHNVPCAADSDGEPHGVRRPGAGHHRAHPNSLESRPRRQ